MSLNGKRVVVTAGGNREPIDPIRFIGNRSSGKMGFALADAAQKRGAVTTLITTIVPSEPEKCASVLYVETCAEMRKAVLSACESTDILIMAAAVSDFRVGHPADQKIKKKGKKLTIELIENDDFLPELADDFIKIGFAAETRDLLQNAEKKLKAKRLDFICANDVTAPDAGFGVDTNRVTILYADGTLEALPLMSKRDLAHVILDRIELLF